MPGAALMKFPSKLLPAVCIAISSCFPLASYADVPHLECGTEALLDEGACVLSLFDIDVVVSSSGMSSLNTVAVRMGDAQAKVTEDVDGIAYLAEIADINADQRPEVFVYVSSAGSGSYGSLLAYVVEADMSLSPVALPDLGHSPEASSGYMGHDEFRVVETSLVRRFPLYQTGDVNAEPTGGHRNVAYKLVRADEGWSLAVDSIDDY